MILKESKARNKKCPYVDGNCVASGCMGWRWHLETEYDKWAAGALAIRPVPIATDKGYCGKI